MRDRGRVAGAVVGCRAIAGAVGIETDDAGAVRGKPIEQRRLGHQHRRAGILQHEARAASGG